jgi:pimeloyl-ACP methyl ester carboxylesterase
MDWPMKNLIIDSVALNFVDIREEKNRTILFLHGNSHSLRTFNKQMNSKIFDDYRLIFLDLPGHGNSSKAENYSLKNFAKILNQFIQELDLKNVIVVGHSMGGHLALNLLKHYQPAGLFIFGTPPLKNPFSPDSFLTNAKASALGKMTSTNEEIESTMSEMEYIGETMTSGVEDYLRTDPNFRAGVFKDLINGVHEDEIVLINSFHSPLFFLLATTDRLINNEYIRNEFLVKSDMIELLEIKSGHSPHITEALEFNKILANFSKKVFKNSLPNNILINDLQHESTYEQRD